MLPRATIPGGEVRHFGTIGGEMAAVSRLARKLQSTGKALVFVYEAGPCGFGLYRLLKAKGHECWVVSPGMTYCVAATSSGTGTSR